MFVLIQLHAQLVKLNIGEMVKRLVLLKLFQTVLFSHKLMELVPLVIQSDFTKPLIQNLVLLAQLIVYLVQVPIHAQLVLLNIGEMEKLLAQPVALPIVINALKLMELPAQFAQLDIMELVKPLAQLVMLPIV